MLAVRSSNLKNCQFKHTDLSGLVLSRNNIELCDFSRSDLRGSQISSSNVSNNEFNACSFIDAKFTKSNLEKCSFAQSDFSGAEIVECNVESNDLSESVWKFTKFYKSNLSNVVFTGTLEDGHFEHCSFYKAKFQNATILNTFFKYNKRFKKVEFVNCRVDKITYAFLKNNNANLTGITVMEDSNHE